MMSSSSLTRAKGQLSLPVDEQERRAEFGKIIAFVAAGFPSAVSIDAATILTYYTMMKDVPIDIVREVAQQILEPEAEHGFFPPCPTWLKMCNAVAAERSRKEYYKLTAGIDRGHGTEYYCADCFDSGWKTYAKDDHRLLHDQAEIMERGHGGRYVQVCRCRSENPVYKRNHPPAPPKFKHRRKHDEKTNTTPRRPSRYESDEDEV